MNVRLAFLLWDSADSDIQGIALREVKLDWASPRPIWSHFAQYSNTWLKRTPSKADTLLRRTKNLGPFGQIF